MQTTNCEAIHCFGTGTVRFAIYPDGFDGPRVIMQISEDALRDVFGARGGPTGLVDACQANFDLIEAKALERHAASPFTAAVLTTEDFAMPILLKAA